MELENDDDGGLLKTLSLRKVHRKCENHLWVILKDSSCKRESHKIEQEGISGSQSSFCCKVKVTIHKFIQTDAYLRDQWFVGPLLQKEKILEISHVDHSIDICKCKDCKWSIYPRLKSIYHCFKNLRSAILPKEPITVFNYMF